MKLYHHPLSGHAHRARLVLSLLGVPHEAIEVDLAAGAHKRPEFLALHLPCCAGRLTVLLAINLPRAGEGAAVFLALRLPS